MKFAFDLLLVLGFLTIWIGGIIILLKLIFPKLGGCWRAVISTCIFVALIVIYFIVTFHIADNVPGAP